MTNLKFRYNLNNRLTNYSLYIAFIAFFIFFFIIVYSHVFSSQLGTADDAAIALAARNMAEGNGFATSIHFDGFNEIESFSRGITTGPTLVLPAALLIAIFGNTPWVPGFLVATVCLILLLLIIYIIRKQTNLMLALIFSSLLILFFYNITAGRYFSSWYVLIGEMPAALLGILGVLIFSVSPYKRQTIIYACFLFGLAFMTKMLALLGFLPLLVWFVYSLIKEKQNRKALFINYIYGVLAFAAPFLMFETWKLFSLGITEYVENWWGFMKAVGRVSGAKDAFSVSFSERFLTRNDTMFKHFGFSIIYMLIVAPIISYLVYNYAIKRHIRLLFTFLMLGAFFHLLYWTFLSLGWHRYALIGLFLYFAALGCIIFVKLPKSVIITIIFFIILVFLGPVQRLKRPITNMVNHGFSYNERLINLKKTVEFLTLHKQDQPFVSAGWASIVDVEYAMPSLQNFKRYDYLGKDDYNRDLLFVRNSRFVDYKNYPGIKQWEKQCEEVLLDAPPYQVSRFKQTVHKLDSSSIIDFSVNGNSNKYTTYGWGNQSYGWGNQQEDFLLTEGKNAGLKFSMANQPKDSLEIQLLGFSYLGYGEIKYQLVSLSVNNHFITEWKINEEKWHTITILSNILSDDESISINLELKNKPVPVTLHYFYDKKSIGIGVKKIVLTSYNND